MIEHAEQIKERVDSLMQSAGYNGHSIVEPSRDGGVSVDYITFDGRTSAVTVGCVARTETKRTWEDFAVLCFRQFVRVME